MPELANDPPRVRRPLGDLALLFTRLGVTAYGGPAAHVSMIENEVVRRRGWMSPQRFLDLFGATSLIPGPSSSELAIYIGYEQAGLLGLLVAGTCFILPAAVITGGLAWAYVRFGSLPEIGGVLYGVKPIIITIIAQAVWSLAPKAIKSLPLAAVGIMALAAAALSIDPILVLVAAGVASAATSWRFGNASGKSGVTMALLGPLGGSAVGLMPVTLLGIFLFFLKIGAVVFGSGYVLLAFLRADLVDRLHWLTESQLLDAVAVGQVTPGPVFTTATFIGYILAGPAGAAIATVAIFLPAFVLVAASRPLVAQRLWNRWKSHRSPTVLDWGGDDAAGARRVAVLGMVCLRVRPSCQGDQRPNPTDGPEMSRLSKIRSHPWRHEKAIRALQVQNGQKKPGIARFLGLIGLSSRFTGSTIHAKWLSTTSSMSNPAALASAPPPTRPL